jgi:hypothetical protein
MVSRCLSSSCLLTAVAALTGCAPSIAPEPPPPGSGGWHLVLDGLAAPLLSAWSSSDGVLYAVGGSESSPLVLRLDRDGWWEMDSGGSSVLWWVHGFSADDVYAVGEGESILHFDGTAWQTLHQGGSDTLYGIWGNSPADLWAVGGNPELQRAHPLVLRRRGGLSWEQVASGLPARANLFKVWGDGAEVVLVGEGGLIAHFDGSSFVPEQVPTTDRLVTIFGTPQRLHVVGGLASSVLLHRSDAGWSAEDAPSSNARSLFGGAVSATGELAVVGMQGYLAQGPDSSLRALAAPTHDCLHAVAGWGNGFVGVGGDLFGSRERGVLIANVPMPAGPPKPWPHPPRPFDAGLSDAGPSDGGGGRPPGARCEDDGFACAEPYGCWEFPGRDGGASPAVCSSRCTSRAHSEPLFGVGACCIAPTPQSLRVCIGSGIVPACP